MKRITWWQVKSLIGLSLFACSSIASAANVDVGGQAILIPPPESFSQATALRVIQFGELATIKEDQLLAVFSEAATVEQEAKGGIFQMDRYGFAQATRNVESYQIPLDRFAKYKADTKAESIAGLSAEDRAELQKNLISIAKWIQSDMGEEVKIGIPRVGYVAILDETPTTLTMVTTVSAPVRVGVNQQRTVEMVNGIALVLVKSKVIWLQLYARLNSRDDFDWVVKSIVKWTRAVSESNQIQNAAPPAPDLSHFGSSKRTSEEGNAVAQYTLARSYAAGKNVAKDLKAALYWFEKSASAGQPNAQTSMGWAYMSDYLGLAPDYKLAMEWNLKAANQGFGEGSSNIGLLYENGWGLPVNHAEAAKWYWKAIEHGAHSGQAELHLGVLYENGRGIGKDLELAAYLYRTVVEKFGNSEFAEEAKTRLALMRATIQSPEPESGETKSDYWRRMQEDLWGKKGKKG